MPTWRCHQHRFHDWQELPGHAENRPLLPGPCGAFAFALASDNPRLRRLVDMALARITDSERLNILRRWSSGHTSLLLQRHLTALSKEEEAWIAAHPNINVW